MIVKVDYNQILKIWQEHLWIDRQSKIESHSAMLLNKTYDMKNFDYIPTYFLYMVDGNIAGCNSGHLCSDNTYRSRGLFVFEQYRRQGIGVALLNETIKQGEKEHAISVWSYPRQSSWKTYDSAGFKLITDWEVGEIESNAYCIKYY